MPVYTMEHTDEADQEDDFKIIPGDMDFTAEVVRIEQKTLPFKDDDGNEIHQLEFSFKIQDNGEYFGHWVKGQAGLPFNDHPRNKLRFWAQNILGGVELNSGFQLNTDDLVGRKCRIHTFVKVYGPEKDKEITLVDRVYPIESDDFAPSMTQSSIPSNSTDDYSNEPF